MKKQMITVFFILLQLFLCVGQGEAQQDEAPNIDSLAEISLERQGCYPGPCPIYKVTLFKDGRVIYIGKENVDHIGQRRGWLHPANFNQLAKLLTSQGFFQLQNTYATDYEDAEISVTDAVHAGKRKTVITHNASVPIKLWGINAAIDGVLGRVKWEKN